MFYIYRIDDDEWQLEITTGNAKYHLKLSYYELGALQDTIRDTKNTFLPAQLQESDLN